MLLQRYSKNPLLKPTRNWWEEKGVFNPGVAIYRRKIVLLYRAWGSENLSRFGLAESSDGHRFKRFADPILEGQPSNPLERLGIEDPRISQIEDTYYIVYTAASVYTIKNLERRPQWAVSFNHPHIPYKIRLSLISTKDFREFIHHGVLLDDLDSKDGALFPEKLKGYYFLLHRKAPDVWLSYSHNLTAWRQGKVMMTAKEGWEAGKMGAGSPPIKTDVGWLLFYHGVDRNKVYRLGAVLLDLDNPARVLKRTKEPLFEPQHQYETEGNITNVVFTCGAVEKNDSYYLYYGAADKVIGLATVKKADLLRHLLDLE